jgi:hypothetical protein
MGSKKEMQVRRPLRETTQTTRRSSLRSGAYRAVKYFLLNSRSRRRTPVEIGDEANSSDFSSFQMAKRGLE